MADMATVMLLMMSSIVMVKSSAALMRLSQKECPAFSIPHFTVLFFVYLIFILGFSIVYLGVELLGFSVVSVHHDDQFNETLDDIYHIGRVIYFSIMTMLTVGYGDIIPLGLGKAIAGIQALIGYLLPAAFLASGFRSN